MRPEVSKFVEMCREIGGKEHFVQGTGGNTSCKIDRRMLIKASGFRLSDIGLDKGHVSVDFNKLRDAYDQTPPATEQESDALVSSSVLADQDGKPSIETAFHSFLGKFTIHTHPIAANLLTCSEDGRELAGEVIDEEFAWVPYSNPGNQLALGFLKVLRHHPGTKVFLLENHGLVVSSDDHEECLHLHNSINDRIMRALRPKGFRPAELVAAGEGFLNRSALGFVKDNRYLFPDAVVFLESLAVHPDLASCNAPVSFVPGKGIFYRTSRAAADNINEVLNSHLYLMDNIRHPKFIKEADVSYITGMEAEKYRRQRLHR